MDETWIHHYTPESREESKKWVKPGKSAPKRPKTQKSTEKIMPIVFWNAHEVISINYLDPSETEGYFGGFDKSYYLEGMEKFKDRWARCIELKREYIEK